MYIHGSYGSVAAQGLALILTPTQSGGGNRHNGEPKPRSVGGGGGGGGGGGSGQPAGQWCLGVGLGYTVRVRRPGLVSEG